jgi:hypothetical protein
MYNLNITLEYIVVHTWERGGNAEKRRRSFPHWFKHALRQQPEDIILVILPKTKGWNEWRWTSKPTPFCYSAKASICVKSTGRLPAFDRYVLIVCHSRSTRIPSQPKAKTTMRRNPTMAGHNASMCKAETVRYRSYLIRNASNYKSINSCWND